MRRFFAPPDQFQGTTVSLDADEARHLRDALRLKAGDHVSVFDGEGNEFDCEITGVVKNGATLEIINSTTPPAPESPLDLTIAAVLLKGDKLDGVVQRCVELGVRRFIPMTSTRCDVKATDGSKRAARFRRIALEATKQCGRAHLMRVDEVAVYGSVLAAAHDGETLRLHFSERDGRSFDAAEGSKKILAFIGPEGGWDDAELAVASDAGVVSVTFGGRVMKADTAAVAIASILQHRFGDLN